MIIEVKNKSQVCLRRLHSNDHDHLFDYLQGLSDLTKSRFGPHGYDRQSIIDIYQHTAEYFGYIAEELLTKKIVAYSILKTGYLPHDRFRFESYGLLPDQQTDCTYAPSVADAWQSCGVGNALFHYILSDLKAKGFKRVLLWGGVQSNNEKAISFYLKNGFKRLGKFEYNGLNDDMMLDVKTIIAHQ